MNVVIHFSLPSSHSEEERLEAKVDWLMDNLNSEDAASFKKFIENKFPKKKERRVSSRVIRVVLV